jgi:hypothetical protein
MPKSYSEMTFISQEEITYILHLVKKRLQFMYGDAFGISYILDPVFLGEEMVHSVEFNDMQTEIFLEYTNWQIEARNT